MINIKQEPSHTNRKRHRHLRAGARSSLLGGAGGPVDLRAITNGFALHRRDTIVALAEARRGLPELCEGELKSAQAAWRSFRSRYRNPLDVRVEEVLRKVVKAVGCDPQRVRKILTSRGDLEFWVPLLALTQEWSSKRDARAMRALRRFRDEMEACGWPFESVTEELVRTQVADSQATLADQTAWVTKERAARDITTNPRSPSFEKVKALRAVARELYDYLLESYYRRWMAERCPSHRLSAPLEDMKADLGRAQRAALMRCACDLVNAAFPTIARLTPARVRGSAPRG